MTKDYEGSERKVELESITLSELKPRKGHAKKNSNSNLNNPKTDYNRQKILIKLKLHLMICSDTERGLIQRA